MFETELKFQVPPTQRAALLKAMATSTAVTTRLQAVYADTADRRLAAEGLALRLRKEGRVWVQTLKGRGDGLMQRLEHEVRLPARSGTPALDAQRHAGTPVGERLLALLADGTALQPIYRTDIRRLHRQVRLGGAVVELAYDRGHIMAGEQRVEVDELELELLRGDRHALLTLARRWAQRHGLWWDVRTKSERGFRLALGLHQVPATRAQTGNLPHALARPQALAQWLSQGLMQALPNAAEIASGTGAPEHLHQLRVAVRRVRTLLRVFAPWAPDAEAALALESAWREPFGLLGLARDQDVIAQSLLPALATVGAPPLPALVAPAGPTPAHVVCSPAFVDLMLQTLALCVPPAPAVKTPPPGDAAADEVPPAEPAKPVAAGALQGGGLARAVQAQLEPLWRQVRKGAARFEAASAEEQHRLRKRIKRLRYALESAEPVLKRKPTEACLKSLRRALQALGDLNDLQVAEGLYRELAAQDPRAWFAVGYLAGQRAGLNAKAARALKQMRDTAPF